MKTTRKLNLLAVGLLPSGLRSREAAHCQHANEGGVQRCKVKSNSEFLSLRRLLGCRRGYLSSVPALDQGPIYKGDGSGLFSP